MNKDAGELVKLHRLYNFCLKNKVEEFLKTSQPAQEDEFCKEEKKVYLDHMRKNHPVEFNNIMRLEESNFWATI